MFKITNFKTLIFVQIHIPTAAISSQNLHLKIKFRFYKIRSSSNIIYILYSTNYSNKNDDTLNFKRLDLKTIYSSSTLNKLHIFRVRFSIWTCSIRFFMRIKNKSRGNKFPTIANLFYCFRIYGLFSFIFFSNPLAYCAKMERINQIAMATH